MIGFFKKKLRFWRYKRKVMLYLALLFDGFPKDELSHPEPFSELSGLIIPLLHEERRLDAKDSAVFAAAILISRRIDLMTSAERKETLEGLRGQLENVASEGIVHMIEVAKWMTQDAHVKMLKHEIMRRLGGTDSEHIRTWQAGFSGNIPSARGSDAA